MRDSRETYNSALESQLGRSTLPPSSFPYHIFPFLVKIVFVSLALPAGGAIRHRQGIWVGHHLQFCKLRSMTLGQRRMIELKTETTEVRTVVSVCLPATIMCDQNHHGHSNAC